MHMPTTRGMARTSAINIRIAPEARNLIDFAVSISGKTRSEFILDSVIREAENTILDQRLFVLSAEDMRRFEAALDEPVAENPALTALLARTPAWEK
jgi:uncharacterized protein (DUF1778 family)